MRWEFFQKKGQTIAFSAFYKAFDAPIEIVQFVQAPNNFQPRNVGDGQVLGLEFELRKNFTFISQRLENYAFISNVSVIQSEIEMSATEFNSRVRNARVGQEIINTREMAGQAPYILNFGLSYNNPENSLDFGVYYNVQGPTLLFVGVADRPDVYSIPFHSLNLTASKNFGKENRMKLGVKISNILDDNREEVFSSFGAADQYFTRFDPGRTFGVSYGYRF